ncbi:MAG: cation:proton antiporter, partial [Trichodesmium sp. St19_bin2]|nr:cation:proton antiporter [Trichodesmium sp. St19_bin2]
MVLAGVLLSLVAIYIASKAGGEFFSWLNFPPVLGELVGGVVIGISALHLVIFPESGADSSSSVIINILEATA